MVIYFGRWRERQHEGLSLRDTDLRNQLCTVSQGFP